jgi:hypothetical protein
MEVDKTRESRKHESRSVQENHDHRYNDIRRLEERISQLRPKLDVMYVSPLDIPKEVIPEGWTYHWFRTSVYDQPDTARDVAAKNNGWTPVPANRHPEIFNSGVSGRKITNHGNIEYCGLVLCEIPMAIYEEMQRRIHEKHLNEVRGLKGLEGLGNDARVFANEVGTNYGFGSS